MLVVGVCLPKLTTTMKRSLSTGFADNGNSFIFIKETVNCIMLDSAVHPNDVEDGQVSILLWGAQGSRRIPGCVFQRVSSQWSKIAT